MLSKSGRLHAVAIAVAALALVLFVMLAAFVAAGPAPRSIALHGSGSFVISGEYPSQNALNVGGLRFGSWNGSDKNTGVLESDTFVAGPAVELTLAGYPSHPKMSLSLVTSDGPETFDLVRTPDPGVSWTRYTYWMPKQWIGKSVRLRAVDGSQGYGGWMGVADLYSMDAATWFYRHFVWKILALASFGLTVTLALTTFLRRSEASWMRRMASAPAFLASLTVTLGVFRLPFILSGNVFNADEAQMTAQAITFLHHPFPWRDYDGTTSGPLNTWIVAVPGMFGITPSLASSRLITVACLAGTLFCLYLFLRASMDDVIARTATLVPLALFCLATDPAYIGYTSETLPMLLIATILALTAMWRKPGERTSWRDFVIGALIGSLVFTKLQAAPLAFFLAVTIPFTWRMKSPYVSILRRLLVFGAGIALLPIVVVAMTWATGVIGDFWLTYIVFPHIYVSGNCCSYAGPSFFFGDSAFRTYLQLSIVLTVCAAATTLAISLVLRARIETRFVLLFGFFAAMSGVAVYAIEAPQTPFFHYLQWLVIPIGGLLGVSLGSLGSVLQSTRRAQFVIACAAIVAIAAAVPVIGSVIADKSRSEQLSFRSEDPTDPNARILQRFIQPRQSVAMWGWMPEYLVYTQATMGTRDAISQFQIEARPLKGYYRDRYLADIRRNRPDFVLEAIGPSAFAFHDEATEGIGSFPALDDYVRHDYALAFSSDSIRLYKRESPPDAVVP